MDYKVLIRETHIDTFGHVNNATYLQLLEEARWEIVTQRGYGLKKIGETKLGPVILEVNLKFLKEIRLRETITINLALHDYKGKVGRMKQQMIKENGEVAAEAEFVFGLFSLKERKLVDPTPEWKHAIGL
jgi:acyl-CoA thioester hydrolase